MSVTVHLLGRPRIDHSTGDTYQFRSRKSWALLTYLIMSERPPTRSQLASLLFADADDPIRALRWSLSEVRRGLGDDASLDGDPITLTLPSDTVVDVAVIMHESWTDAIELPGLGLDLLESLTIRGAAAFETWLLSQQRHVAAVSEAVLHEAALGSMARGKHPEAIGYAVRATAMSPLDENHQALLIRLYRMTGDDEAAEKQYAAYAAVTEAELGVPPGAAVQAAMRETERTSDEAADDATIAALIEAGSAAASAGAVDAGVVSLRTAVRLADAANSTALRVNSRQVLGEALIHSLRGLDEEGTATLYEAADIAISSGLADRAARAWTELGYVDFLRARYDRAERWLTDAMRLGADSPSVLAKATTYLGAIASDRADYSNAIDVLCDAIRHSSAAGEPRREAFARSMLGRAHLARGDVELAAEQLDASIKLAEQDHWLLVMPWPQALRGEAFLAVGDTVGAASIFEQAFARACQIGDPCWEGMAARGLAMVAETNGASERAFEILADARARASRQPDAYSWLIGHILDAQCALGVRYGHPETYRWVEEMRTLASRTTMRELNVRSLLHGAALGNADDLDAAVLLAADIDNPALHTLLPATPSPG